MATKKVGTVIREAREKAGMSQESLARKAAGVSLGEVRSVEAGEADLTQTKLKALAKALGVTQATLLGAPKNLSAAKKPASTAKKPASPAAQKPAAKTQTPKTPANANSTMKVTSTEKKLIEAYRAASADAKKAATKLLKGEREDLLDTINGKDTVGNAVSGFLENALGNLLGR